MNFDIQGVLFPNFFTMIVQLCATLVLFLLCKKLLWKPARNIIQTRQNKMNADLKDAEESRNAAKAELDEAKRSLEEAREKSGEIITSAKSEADELKKAILEDAKKDARNKVDDAQMRIDKMYREAREDLKDEIVDVALAAVEKLLEEKSDSTADMNEIRKYVDEVKK